MKRNLIMLLTASMLLGLSSGICAETKSLKSTAEILVTSAAGDKLAEQKNVEFNEGSPTGTVITINPDKRKQTVDGIGTSFTESSAFVLAHLPIEKRKSVMEKIFSKDGANFTLTRTHIGACDFSVKGRYSYADDATDLDLAKFTISADSEGFDPSSYPDVIDTSYDLLPMIKEALAIKNQQQDKRLRIVGSAWTAPAWMKDIETWYIPGSPENNWQGTGGSLKEEFIPIYSNYLIKYLDAYKKEGIDIWGLTPVNEPHGNNGQWESMHFSPESQNLFIKKYLGPDLHKAGYQDVKLLIYDQNRDGLEHWADVIFTDKETEPYIYGAAVHWYESTFKVYEDVFNKVHKKFPEFSIIHTEGCIDDLGKDAPDGVTDPERFKESNWFMNDDFWWSKTATDWAYSVTWQGVKTEDHPIYVPVHRYARNIIVSLDNWVKGWIDWNIVLDKDGGPNHVGNFCGAPIMIDTATKEIHYTPIFHVLAQLSRTIRPGDVAVETAKSLDNLDEDALHSCATINDDDLLTVQVLNTTSNPVKYKLLIHDVYAEITISANTLQSVKVQL